MYRSADTSITILIKLNQHTDRPERSDLLLRTRPRRWRRYVKFWIIIFQPFLSVILVVEGAVSGQVKCYENRPSSTRACVNIGKMRTSSTTSYTDSGLASNTKYTYTVTAQDAVGNGSTPSNSAAVTTPVAQCPCSIWQDGTPTGSAESNDPNAQTTGRAVPGEQQRVHHGGAVLQGGRTIPGRIPGACGPRPGSCWPAGTFAGETASGWQELDFSSPVAVTAGTTYVASYFSSTGYPAYTSAGAGVGGDERAADRAGRRRGVRVRLVEHLPDQHV